MLKICVFPTLFGGHKASGAIASSAAVFSFFIGIKFIQCSFSFCQELNYPQRFLVKTLSKAVLWLTSVFLQQFLALVKSKQIKGTVTLN